MQIFVLFDVGRPDKNQGIQQTFNSSLYKEIISMFRRSISKQWVVVSKFRMNLQKELVCPNLGWSINGSQNTVTVATTAVPQVCTPVKKMSSVLTLHTYNQNDYIDEHIQYLHIINFLMYVKILYFAKGNFALLVITWFYWNIKSPNK